MNTDTTFGNYVTVFDSPMNCFSTCQFLVTDSELVVPGQGYRFRVSAIYQNGYAETSDDSDLVYACTPPSYQNPPSLVAVSSSEITLQWDYPLNLGHCALSGFALHMNDGAGGDSYSEVDSGLIRDKPSYTQHSTSSPSTIGATYLFKVEAYNPKGSTFSEAVGFVFADIPSTPTSAPTSNSAKTTASNLSIQVETVTDDG